jgi:hypothetical protein
MKRSQLIFILAFFAVTIFGSCGNRSTKEKPESVIEATKVQYTCPMHPEVIDDEPGDCPKCGMDLVEKV